MKPKIHFLLFSSLIMLISWACTSPSKSPDNDSGKELAEDQNDAKFSHNEKTDADFVFEATIMTMKEIDAGKYARDHASADHVKALSKQMTDYHEKALTELQSLAREKGISIPSELSESDQNETKKLIEAGPGELDKKYCDMMVEDHKKAIDDFEKASKNCSDPAIKLWASNSLDPLRKHLDNAMVSQETIKSSH